MKELPWEVIHSKVIKNSKLKSKIEASEIHEVWTYNFGSHKFIQYLSFINNELVLIESGSYGFDNDKQGNYSQCGYHASVNDSKIDIFRKCGKPGEIFNHPKVFRKYSVSDKKLSDQKEITETEETWIYDSTESRFIYHIKFSNGKVSEIKRE